MSCIIINMVGDAVLIHLFDNNKKRLLVTLMNCDDLINQFKISDIEQLLGMYKIKNELSILIGKLKEKLISEYDIFDIIGYANVESSLGKMLLHYVRIDERLEYNKLDYIKYLDNFFYNEKL